jgi:hypothetical protein
MADKRSEFQKRMEDNPPPGMKEDGTLEYFDEADIPKQQKAFNEALAKGEFPPGWRRKPG